jgi:glycine cleavage system aminomethyltransferase T
MSLPEELSAIRNSVAVSRMDHVIALRLRGERLFAALDRVIAADLHLRDGQMLQSLILDEQGHVFADVYLGCDDDEFFLLAEGPSAAELTAFLSRQFASDGVEIEDQSASHGLVMLNGPYAWELLALLAGPDVVGLPYHTFFHFDGGLGLRAGKTGEYGYGLLVPRQDVEGLCARLLELGGSLDARAAGLEALDLCALENWHLNIRREGREPVTPIELQLQWRVSYRKNYVGSEALVRRKREGPRQRLTCLVSKRALEVGSEVTLAERSLGRIVNVGYSTLRQDWTALGLLDIQFAHPGIDALRAGVDRVELRTVSPPLLNNRSLHVSPQIHSYATRNEFAFPSLLRR